MSSFTSREDAMKRFKALIANQDYFGKENLRTRLYIRSLTTCSSTNTDYSSLRVLSDLDINTMDKLCLFRCTEDERPLFVSPRP